MHRVSTLVLPCFRLMETLNTFCGYVPSYESGSVIHTSLGRIHILAFCPGVVARVVGRARWKSVELSLPAKIANQEQCPTAGGNPKVKGPHQNPERCRDGDRMTYASNPLVCLMLSLVCLIRKTVSLQLLLHMCSPKTINTSSNYR